MRWVLPWLWVVACDGGKGDLADDTDPVADDTDDSPGGDDTDVDEVDGILGLTSAFVPHALLREGERLWVAGEQAGDMALVALRWSDLAVDTGWRGGEPWTLDFGGPTDGFLPQDVDAAFDVVRHGPNLAVAGVARDYEVSGAGSFAVALIDDSGAPVETFGESGRVITDWGVPSHVQSLASDGDGVLAWGVTVQGRNTLSAVRYLNDGNPDRGYSDDDVNAGVVVPSTGDEGAQVFVPVGGDLVVGGTSPVVRRFGANGRLNMAFAGDGELRLDDGFFSLGVALAGGDLLLAGTVNAPLEDGSEVGALRLVRITPDGELVTSWADGGVAVVYSPIETFGLGDLSLPGSVIKVRGLGVAADGSVAVYAQALTITGQAPILMKVQPDGQIDAAFGDDGAIALPGAFALFEGALIGKDDLLVVDGDEVIIVDTWLRDAEGGGIESFPVALRIAL
jgi:hypothetical protein